MLSSTTSPLLSAQQLSCERGGLPLFNGLDFTVQSGELLQVVGPNGSGKTTLLRLLAGLSAMYTGKVLWHGSAAGSETPRFLYIGHRIGIKALLSPLENLRWYMAAVSTPEKDSDQRILQALAYWQLQGYEHHPCYQLSAGQQQRVALSRLLLHPAPVWLLDEPFTAIDQTGIAQLETLLLSHAEHGGAAVLTTHHQFRTQQHLRFLVLQSAPGMD
jgi:heme exporter protein A